MSSRKPLRRRRKPSVRLILEELESRVVLSEGVVIRPTFHVYHAPGTYPSGLRASPVGILPQSDQKPTRAEPPLTDCLVANPVARLG